MYSVCIVRTVSIARNSSAKLDAHMHCVVFFDGYNYAYDLATFSLRFRIVLVGHVYDFVATILPLADSVGDWLKLLAFPVPSRSTLQLCVGDGVIFFEFYV